MIPDGRPQVNPTASPNANPQGNDVPSTGRAPAAVSPLDAPPSIAESAEPRPYATPIELVIIAGIVIVDQVTKEIVRRTLPLHGEPAQLIPGFLDLTHVQNTGAAFGLLNAADFPYKAAVMIGIALMALIAIAAYATQLGFHERLARVGLALILGGAFGNLIDRALFGHVVDFVDVYWGTAHFWAFNVADAAITVGAILVLLDMIGLGRRHASHPV
jgi:signal peptidase II